MLGTQDRDEQTPLSDALRLVHELQVHQIELEMQHEELQQAQADTQAALDRYSEFYDSAPIGYFTLDREGVIRQLNLAGAQLLNADRDGLLAKRFRIFVADQDGLAFDRFLHRVFAGDSRECCDLSLQDPDAQRAALVVHLEAIRGASGSGCSVVAFDITERVQAEIQLRAYQTQLETMVSERTAELVAANRELEVFTFAASHDLRGPLGRINSFSTLLERNCGDLLDGENRLLLNLIRQNATRLVHLVDDLLVHARVSQHSLDLRPLDIPTVAQAIVQEKASEKRDASVEIRINLPTVQVMADSQALDQVLGNLVENAIKYSSRAPSPVVEIGGEPLGERFRLWVKDNGVGFDMKYHDKIFQIFQRLHTYTEYPGSGVGLALVKRAVERMGGKVWAESAPGQGATFFLELQAAA